MYHSRHHRSSLRGKFDFTNWVFKQMIDDGTYGHYIQPDDKLNPYEITTYHVWESKFNRKHFGKLCVEFGWTWKYVIRKREADGYGGELNEIEEIWLCVSPVESECSYESD